jgi:tight adherence protein B
MMALLAAALMFFAIVLGVVGLWWALARRAALRARLRGSGGTAAAETSLIRAEHARRGWRTLVGRLALHRRLLQLNQQAGRAASGDPLALVAGAALAGGVLGWWRVGLLWAVPCALAGGALPVLYLLYKRQRRIQHFEAQFPDALDTLTRSIRAGYALAGAIQVIADDMPDPVGVEFRVVAEEIRLGLDAGEALARLHRRVPTDDLRFFQVAIQIQRQAGGNLAEILERLAEVIRERFKLLSHARVLSAQHRWTAVCVGLSPVLFVVIFELTRPGYFRPVLDSALGPYLVGVGLILEVLGFAAIWRIARIEV